MSNKFLINCATGKFLMNCTNGKLVRWCNGNRWLLEFPYAFNAAGSGGDYTLAGITSPILVEDTQFVGEGFYAVYYSNYGTLTQVSTANQYQARVKFSYRGPYLQNGIQRWDYFLQVIAIGSFIGFAIQEQGTNELTDGESLTTGGNTTPNGTITRLTT
jgi:hypothetical protein